MNLPLTEVGASREFWSYDRLARLGRRAVLKPHTNTTQHAKTAESATGLCRWAYNSDYMNMYRRKSTRRSGSQSFTAKRLARLG